MIEWLQQNWFLVGAFGTLLGFGLDKGYNFWKDRKTKQQAYNRLFTAVVRLYFSFLRNSRMYDNATIPVLLKEYLKPIIDESDTLSRDLQEYKNVLQKESEILPEYAIIANELFDSLDNFSMLDKLYKRLDSKDEIEGSVYFGIKKSLYATIKPKFEWYFKNTLDKLKNKVSVPKELYDNLYDVSNPSEHSQDVMENVNILFQQYSNNNVVSSEVLETMKNAIQNIEKK